MPDYSALTAELIDLLKQLIRTPSISREEDKTAQMLQDFIEGKGIAVERIKNNVIARCRDFVPGRPTVLLNSHHDTVKPSSAWTCDPFGAEEHDGRITGLGSNDAGASLVSLLGAFLVLDAQIDRPYNIIYAASAEEEVSGTEGAELFLKSLGTIDFGIVGEPTKMEMAIAEKGLMVLDCKAIGKAGHAAREEGINAIYLAMKDIEWFRTYQFPRVSEVLGPMKMTVSVINAGKQHNVVPDVCEFTVDVRLNGQYSNAEALEHIRQHVGCEVTARSLRLNSSQIPLQHPAVQRGISLGRPYYGSPTMSDQVFMPFPTIKMGPGDSARSHTADEYILRSEIEEAVPLYVSLLSGLQL